MLYMCFTTWKTASKNVGLHKTAYKIKQVFWKLLWTLIVCLNAYRNYGENFMASCLGSFAQQLWLWYYGYYQRQNAWAYK